MKFMKQTTPPIKEIVLLHADEGQGGIRFEADRYRILTNNVGGVPVYDVWDNGNLHARVRADKVQAVFYKKVDPFIYDGEKFADKLEWFSQLDSKLIADHLVKKENYKERLDDNMKILPNLYVPWTLGRIEAIDQFRHFNNRHNTVVVFSTVVSSPAISIFCLKEHTEQPSDDLDGCYQSFLLFSNLPNALVRSPDRSGWFVRDYGERKYMIDVFIGYMQEIGLRQMFDQDGFGWTNYF